MSANQHAKGTHICILWLPLVTKSPNAINRPSARIAYWKKTRTVWLSTCISTPFAADFLMTTTSRIRSSSSEILSRNPSESTTETNASGGSIRRLKAKANRGSL